MGAANEREDNTDSGDGLDEVSAERVARNNALFRVANEEIVAKAAAGEHGWSATCAV